MHVPAMGVLCKAPLIAVLLAAALSSFCYIAKESGVLDDSNEETTRVKLTAGVLNHHHHYYYYHPLKTDTTDESLTSAQQNNAKKHPRDVAVDSRQSSSAAATRDEQENLYLLQSSTRSFVQSRRRAYETAGLGVNWWMRGVGYLWEMRNIALAVVVPPTTTTTTTTTTFTDNNEIVIKIINVHPNASLNDPQDCAKLSIWVRVRGPEIVAALAQPVVSYETNENNHNNTRNNDGGVGVCHWEYHADVRVPGNYTVDAKVLNWNARGMRPSTRQCQKITNATTTRMTQAQVVAQYHHLQHGGFQGFKMNNFDRDCCEFCSRYPGCTMWAMPAFRLPAAGMHPGNNGCEFFFDGKNNSSDDVRIPQSYLLGDLNATWSSSSSSSRSVVGDTADSRRYVVGRPHTGQKVWFVGCGWSIQTLDFPCLSGELDDQVFALNNQFVLMPELSTETTTSTQQQAGREILPLCELRDEFNGTDRGRWVREPWLEECPPYSASQEYQEDFLVSSWTGDQPHCWHRDDLTVVGHKCMDVNCALIRNESKYYSPMRDKQWMGVWRDRHCDYMEFTDAQLQQCLTVNKIMNIKKSGNSISRFLYEFVHQRIANLTFYDKPDGVHVEIATLALLHLTMKSQDDLRKQFMRMRNLTDNPRKQVYVPSTLFLSSERANLAMEENVESIFKIALEILPAKGYKLFNVLEASTAFTYDTATQLDGMHLIGPPMKLLITKFFHHLCKDQVDGTRM